MSQAMWTNPYCNTSHFRGRCYGGRVQITIQDMSGAHGPFFEVSRLQLNRDARPYEGKPGGVYTPTHHAYRRSLPEIQAVGEGWANGDFSAPERN